MISFSITALVLIYLEGRTGHQVGVRELADHLCVADPDIEAALDSLEVSHGVRVQRIAGLAIGGCRLPQPTQDR